LVSKTSLKDRTRSVLQL